MNPFQRSLIGFVLAAFLALAARRAGALSPSGAWGALVVGTVACAAGWGWSAVLLAFFVSSSLLSRWKRATKERASRSIVEKGGERDAWQVMANGGVFTLAALGAVASPSGWWALAGLGALAAATADTWATEIGTAVGGMPRSVVGWRSVPMGTSGAVSAAGLAASVAAALFFGTVVWVAGFARELVAPVTVAGVAGALVDTVAGATIQERRLCPACGTETERRIHDCGTESAYHLGLAGFDNDIVNLTSSVAGAGIAILFGRLLS
jgi:uncharacterized protein (TIGR00297 family)